MSIKQNNKLALFLNDALFMENAAVERLESRIGETSILNTKQQLQRHLEETKEQQNRLKQLITQLGGQPIVNIGKLPISSTPEELMRTMENSMTAAEQEVRRIIEDITTENFEATGYNMLLQIVQKMNINSNESIISVLNQSLQEENNMVEWIKANTPVMLDKLWPEIESSVKN